MANSTEKLLSFLGKGGNYQYFVSFGETGINQYKLFEVDKLPSIPNWNMVYFPVNPVKNQPEKMKSKNNDVMSLNCLYAEFDGKDFYDGETKLTSESIPEQRERANKLALEHIYSLSIQPSIIVFSGGGYHCYWLLKVTQTVNDENRDELNTIQNKWVTYVKGDKGAKDLSRVLRVPLSTNNKYKPSIQVVFIKEDYNILYNLEALTGQIKENELESKSNLNNGYGKLFEGGTSKLSQSQSIYQGERDNEVFLYASSLRGQGLEFEEILNALRQANNNLVNPPLDDRLLIDKAKRVCSYSPNSLFSCPLPEDPLEPYVYTDEDYRGYINDIPYEIINHSSGSTVKTQNNRKARWTRSELMDVVLQPTKWVISNLIPEGLCLLSGRPKFGKSWMMLQMVGAVSTGGTFFGERVQKGKCLYLALEDNARRLKQRTELQKLPRNADVTFITEYTPLHKGGLEELEKEIISEGYRLVVIDTLTRAYSGLDQNDQPKISKAIASLQELASRNSISIILIHHTTKPKGFLNMDAQDAPMNSSAITASCDQSLVVYKDSGRTTARMIGSGRDLEEIDFAITFDRETLFWNKEGNSYEVKLTNAKQEIINTIKILGKVQASKIASYLGKDRSYIARTLNDMVDSELIKRESIEGNVYFEYIEVSPHGLQGLHSPHGLQGLQQKSLIDEFIDSE